MKTRFIPFCIVLLCIFLSGNVFAVGESKNLNFGIGGNVKFQIDSPIGQSNFTFSKTLSTGNILTVFVDPMTTGTIAIWSAMYDSLGNPVLSYGQNGKYRIRILCGSGLSDYFAYPRNILIDDIGNFYIQYIHITDINQPPGETVNCGAILKINKSGKIDSSFGDNGRVYTPNRFKSNSNLTYLADGDLIFDNNGKLVSLDNLVGFPYDSNYVTRFHLDGKRDSSFGVNGSIRLQNNSKFHGKIIIHDSLNKYTIAGYGNESPNYNTEFRRIKMIRYNNNGVIDSNFRNAGQTVDTLPWSFLQDSYRKDNSFLFYKYNNNCIGFFAAKTRNYQTSVNNEFPMDTFINVKFNYMGQKLALGNGGIIKNNLAAIGYKKIENYEPDKNGDIYCMGLKNIPSSSLFKLDVFRLKGDNLTIDQNFGDSGKVFISTVDTMYHNYFWTPGSFMTVDKDIIVGTDTTKYLSTNSFIWTSQIKLSKTKERKISGKVYIDVNSNCLKEPTELGYPNLLVKLTNLNTGKIKYCVSENDGSYVFFDDSTICNYKLDVILNSPFYTKNCTSIYNTTYLLDNIKLDTIIHLPVNIILPISIISVTGSSTQLIRGFNSTLKINCINTGTISSSNTKVKVRLNKWLTYLSSSIAPSANSGQELLFNIGNLDPFVNKSFTILVKLSADTNVLLDQNICTKLEILPDSFPPTVGWDSSYIRANSICQGDSVYLTVKNFGKNMNKKEALIIKEDDFLYRTDSFKLNKGDSLRIALYAGGKTYFFNTKQPTPEFNPYGAYAVAHEEGCRASTVFSNSVNKILPNNYQDPSLSREYICGRALAACDPNRKDGFPLGTGMENFIDSLQEIEYKIQFQNLGNYKASDVVIVDTIDTKLNLESIKFGMSSHSYYPLIGSNRIVKFIFQNIDLPYLASDTLKSQGYVIFKIKLNSGLPIGTVINNRADIYFDFNPAIKTNLTKHTIGYPCVKKIKYLYQTICASSVFQFKGINFNTTGIYYDTLQTTNLCDSIIVLNLKVNPTKTSSFSQTICANQTYLWNGVNLNTTGAYKDTFSTYLNCDSVVTLNLTVNPTKTSSFSQTICANETFLWNGVNLNTAGAYKDTFATYQNCDSIVTLNLTVNPTKTSSFSQTICANQTYLWNGVNLNTAGAYKDTFSTYLNCDSVVTLILTVNPTKTSSFSQTICANETYLWNGVNLNTTGAYKDTFTTYQNCDSVVTLNLTVNIPKIISIIQSKDSLITNKGLSNYVWKKDNVIIPNANNYFIIPTNSGSYISMAKDNNNCNVVSPEFNFGISFINELNLYQFRIQPNPMEDRSVIVLGRTFDHVKMIQIDSKGAEIMNHEYSAVDQINLNKAMFPSAGTYYILLQESGKTIYKSKLIVE